jgi:hypothetical protein
MPAADNEFTKCWSTTDNGAVIDLDEDSVSGLSPAFRKDDICDKDGKVANNTQTLYCNVFIHRFD